MKKISNIFVSLTLGLLAVAANAQQAPVNLGSGSAFAILAGTTVTVTGAGTIGGNVGIYPGTAYVSGNPPVTIKGTLYAGGPIAAQAQTDLALRSNFPGFSTNRIGGTVDFLTTFHSREARTAATSYRGVNRPRYMNPTYDELADRYAVTIPFSERMAIARDLARIISDQVVFLPLVHDPQPLLASNRLRNVYPREGDRFETWNAEQWELAD